MIIAGNIKFKKDQDAAEINLKALDFRSFRLNFYHNYNSTHNKMATNVTQINKIMYNSR